MAKNKEKSKSALEKFQNRALKAGETATEKTTNKRKQQSTTSSQSSDGTAKKKKKAKTDETEGAKRSVKNWTKEWSELDKADVEPLEKFQASIGNDPAGQRT